MDEWVVGPGYSVQRDGTPATVDVDELLFGREDAMDEQELATIEQRARDYSYWTALSDDVRALVAEVRRLRGGMQAALDNDNINCCHWAHEVATQVEALLDDAGRLRQP